MAPNNSQNIKIYEDGVQLDLDNSGITVVSSDETVATVIPNGNLAAVTGVSSGNATITVSKGTQSITIPVVIS